MIRPVVVFAATLAISAWSGPDASPEAIPQEERRLDGFSLGVKGDALPPDWEVRTVRGASRPRSQVVSDARLGHVLQITARDQAAFFVRKLDTTLKPGSGRLRWTWRVDELPDEMALGSPDADDSPARVFVMYGDGGLFSRPNVIFYTWGRDERPDSAWIQESDHNAAVIVLRDRGDPLNRWVHEERDLARDHARMFGEDEPEPVTAIGILVDTDDAGGSAAARLGSVSWLPGGDRTPNRPLGSRP